jgi:hypothetical protein
VPTLQCGVARWFIFIAKIPIWVYFHSKNPDLGIISQQKSQFGYVLEVFGMENVDIFYDIYNTPQTYTLTGFEPTVFCSGSGPDDNKARKQIIF